MRITIKHDTPDEGLTLPINYHHILQSIVYANMKDSSYSSLHEKAYEYNKREYKMFTFSELFGRYEIHNKTITFYGRVSFKIASPDNDLIYTLAKSFKEKGILYGDQLYKNIFIEEGKEIIEKTETVIKMISPVCVYSTDIDSGKTYFFEPGTKEFKLMLGENFRRKYIAFYGREPAEIPTIEPKCVLPKHKKVTDYKGLKITGWMGEYIIAGNPDMLNFWADSGIGSKNAEGFGMFDVNQR